MLRKRTLVIPDKPPGVELDVPELEGGEDGAGGELFRAPSVCGVGFARPLRHETSATGSEFDD